MKSSPPPRFADLRQLVALTAFLAQKGLHLAGGALFEGKPADPAAVGQKRSQIDRISQEFDLQFAAHAAASPLETQRAAALMALNGALREIGREAEALSEAAAAPRPDPRTLDALHAVYEGATTLLAQAVGACVEEARLNLRKTVATLRNNARCLEELEAALPAGESALAVPPVRRLSGRTRHLAEEISASLASLAPAMEDETPVVRPTPGPQRN